MTLTRVACHVLNKARRLPETIEYMALAVIWHLVVAPAIESERGRQRRREKAPWG